MISQFLYYFNYSQIKKNFSLFIIMLGACFFFISNLLFKEVLSSKVYGEYSVIITYFSVVFLIGILGLEQSFLRISDKKNKNELFINKLHLFLILLVSILTTFFFTISFKILYNRIEINFFLLFFSTFSMTIMLFLFNILRLNSSFILSQILSNYWKFVLFLLSTYFYLNKFDNFNFFINFLLINIILITLFTVIFILKKIKFFFIKKQSSKEIIKISINYSIAITLFTITIFLDRYFIEKKFTLEEFGNFFYLTNFFLAPFSILQNYIGFKYLIIFKNNFNSDFFNSLKKKSIILGAILSLILSLLAFFVDSFGILNFDFKHYFWIIILLLIMGIARLYSSSILSAFEALIELRGLIKSNRIIFLATSIIFIFTLIYVNSIEVILLMIIFLWIFRSIIQKKILLFQLKSCKV